MHYTLWGVILCLLLPVVDGHGYLADPRAQFKEEQRKTVFLKTIDATVDPAFGDKKWDHDAGANAKTFASSLSTTKYTSLRALIDSQVPDCGNTRTDIAPVVVDGKTSMKWQNDDERAGFIASHHGPCEAWVDGTKVFHVDDCRDKYRSYPAEIPMDYSACRAGSTCIFTFYWLALHEPKWQIYKQCVPITRHQDQNGGNKDHNGGNQDKNQIDCRKTDLGSTYDGPTHLRGVKINWKDESFMSAFGDFFSAYHEQRTTSNSQEAPANV